ncbi:MULTISPECIES: EAL domain-containing protein [Kluyvera]|uniref:EAL domain-containing protein n=1 Tax=Kluyvera genomosp. 3 TaxID=2774055 RepID=A0A6G9RGJ2_9ENTR|nr:EAL domain-containing protein [Kluyvera genomosp. 3]QIR25423.1 EAL domain-containing protein [Kluyvera genomosp. 3]
MDKSAHYVVRCVENAKFDVGIDFVIQPIFDLSRFACIGGEVLVRGTHRRNVVPPVEFIQHLEENGTIVDMGYYVMEKSLSFIAQKRADDQEEFMYTLNISAVQLNDPEFAYHALGIVETRHLRTAQLVFEITSGQVALTEVARQNLQTLQDDGINIAWDGIGTLAALQERLAYWIPDYIKLDRSCLACGQQDETEQILQLIAQHDIDVIIEGVENYTQTSNMLKQGVKFGQGYLFSRPISKESFQREYMQHQQAQTRASHAHR